MVVVGLLLGTLGEGDLWEIGSGERDGGTLGVHPVHPLLHRFVEGEDQMSILVPGDPYLDRIVLISDVTIGLHPSLPDFIKGRSGGELGVSLPVTGNQAIRRFRPVDRIQSLGLDVIPIIPCMDMGDDGRDILVMDGMVYSCREADASDVPWFDIGEVS